MTEPRHTTWRASSWFGYGWVPAPTKPAFQGVLCLHLIYMLKDMGYVQNAKGQNLIYLQCLWLTAHMNAEENNLLKVTDSYKNIRKTPCFGKYDLFPQSFFMFHILIEKPWDTKLIALLLRVKKMAEKSLTTSLPRSLFSRLPTCPLTKIRASVQKMAPLY